MYKSFSHSLSIVLSQSRGSKQHACWTVAATGCMALPCWFAVCGSQHTTHEQRHMHARTQPDPADAEQSTPSCMQHGPKVIAHLIQPAPCSSTAAEQANKRPVARFFLLDASTPLSPGNNPSQPQGHKATLCQHTCDSQGRDHTCIQNWRSLRRAGAKVGNWSRTVQHGSLSVCRDCGCSKHTCAPKQQDTHDTAHSLCTSTPKQHPEHRGKDCACTHCVHATSPPSSCQAKRHLHGMW